MMDLRVKESLWLSTLPVKTLARSDPRMQLVQPFMRNQADALPCLQVLDVRQVGVEDDRLPDSQKL